MSKIWIVVVRSKNVVELASDCSFFDLLTTISAIILTHSSPHWTRKMNPTTERFAKKVRFTGTKSRSEILIVLWIWLISPAWKKRREPETQHYPRLEAQLSKKETPDHWQTMNVKMTEARRITTPMTATISLFRFVDFRPRIFRTSCSVDRYSSVNKNRLSHWKKN